MSVLLALGELAATVLGELVGPSACAACDARVSIGALFCPTCAISVERLERGDRAGGAIAAFEYGGAIATAVGRLKYEDRADLGPRLGAAMVGAAAQVTGAVDVVVPVPLHPRRLAARGYNQAALLAAPVARSLGARLVPRALARDFDTPRQASLDRAERLVNVRGAFHARRKSPVAGARVLLVDDVRTTGATLEACGAELERAGARTVFTLVLARASNTR